VGKRGPKKGTKPKRQRISKKEKKDIIRDIVKKYPNYRRYGFLVVLQDFFKAEYKLRLSKPYVSQLLKEVIEDWSREKETIYSKRQILESLARLYEKAEEAGSIGEQRRILTDIAKIEGVYIERHEDVGKDLPEKGETIEAFFRKRLSGKLN